MAINLAKSDVSVRYSDFECIEGANVIEFCRTLKSSTIRFNRLQLFVLDTLDATEVFAKKKNLLFSLNETVCQINKDTRSARYIKNSDPPSAAFVSCPVRHKGDEEFQHKGNEEFQVLMLLNGDTEFAEWGLVRSIVGDMEEYEFPVVSWSALTNFYGYKIKNVNLAISNGNLRLVDYTPDERIPVSEKDKKERRKKNPKLTPPKLGFVMVGNHWHRSGFCLFYDERKELCLLAGQDEGSYFIVQLPKKVNTIEEAVDVLIPEDARVPGTKRQGEWFFVPCNKKEVPSVSDTLLLFEGDCSSNVFMPLDDEDSNRHFVVTCDGRVGKDGHVYVHNVTMKHDEHRMVEMTGWCRLVKNTAVRSYSEGGVD